MGNFEKLSVLVIGVIIVMILVVAIYTWTENPADDEDSSSLDNRAHARLVTPPAPTNDPHRGGDSAEPAPRDPWRGFEPPAPAPRPVTPAPDIPGEEPAPRIDSPGPASDPVSDPEAPVEAVEKKYVVKPGDTYGHISQREYGTVKHWQRIQDRNGIPADRLRPGMELWIPVIVTDARAPENKPGTTAAAGAPKPGATYVVRDGDTIEGIAKAAYGTLERWTDIWFENMERIEDPERLAVGTSLELPN